MLTQAIVAEARAHESQPAFLAPGRSSLTYGELARHILDVADALRGLGFHRQDRIALVLPDGPELASAIVTVTAAAVAAPLNPTYTVREFDQHFDTLGVSALIVEAASPAAARVAAQQRGLPIIELSRPVDAAAGLFTLDGHQRSGDGRSGPACGDDDELALVLTTSGTTSRPKIVPLTQRNLTVSARNISQALSLSPNDRCLNVMPLFHIHGIVGAVLSSLVSGGSVVCTPGFSADHFVQWVEEFRPTWFTATPTIHHAIVVTAVSQRERFARAKLRFVRSCSAALPQRLLSDMEALFQAPVVEAYGMTEAAHQIACNPLPPAARKPNSVGIATGTSLAVIDDAGNVLGPDQTGEVAIRGDNVMRGYLENPEANERAFVNGWVRTGDQGRLDRDGYLFLTGRLKELINRGAEKIAPREIEEVLLEHPEVAEAAAFAVPHRTLGEDVAVALVVRPPASLTTQEVRRFIAGRVAPFKVPRHIVFVERIPKGPTGKVQRNTLATTLGVAQRIEPRAPSTPRVIETVELQLMDIWERVLGLRPQRIDDDFFELGGNSLLAARAMAEIEGIFGRRLSLSTLFEGATIEYLARALLAEESAASQSLLIPVQPHGARAPFFFHHGDRDGGGFYCLSLARHLGPDQPFYALKPHGTEGPLTMRTIEEMAADHLRLIRSVRPNGPYVLAGFCHGGLIAFDIARRLVADGEVVAFLGLISPPLLARSTSEFVARRILSALIASTAALAGRDVHAGVHAFVWLCERLSALRQVVRGTVTEPGDHRSISDHARQLEEAYNRAVEGYVPRSYPGRVTVFWPEGKRVGGLGDVTIGWRQVAKHVELHVVPGEHLTSITRHLPALAALLTTCLDTAEAGLGPAIASSRHGSSEIFQQPVFGGMTVAESIRAFGGRNAWLPVRCHRHRSPATPRECLGGGNSGVGAEKVMRRNRP